MKNFLLLILFFGSVCQSQELTINFTHSYHSGTCLYKTIDIGSPNEPDFKIIGNEVLILYSKDSNVYDISWMEDTSIIAMQLVFQVKMPNGNLFQEAYGKVKYFLNDKMESDRTLILTTAEPVENQGYRRIFKYQFVNMKKKNGL